MSAIRWIVSACVRMQLCVRVRVMLLLTLESPVLDCEAVKSVLTWLSVKPQQSSPGNGDLHSLRIGLRLGLQSGLA